MPDTTTEVRYSFPIFKFDETPDGDIVVYGRCTDGSVDADRQIVDSRWSGKALEEWLGSGGNMRVQHSPFLYPAGKGLALDIDKDGDGAHWLKALVVEDNAKKLVQKGVLRDFSVGILDPRLSYRNPLAPEGTIVGGRIGEVSLVDRGSNKNSGFTIAKSVGDSPELALEWFGKFATSPLAVASAISKKKLKSGKIVDSSGKDRSDVPQDQFAGPGDTFPVDNRNDVSDAASLAHHAKDPDAVRSKIRDVAEHKLGMSEDELPPSLQGKADNGQPCPACGGDGHKANGKMCKKCKGSGFMAIAKADAADDQPAESTDEDDSIQDYDAESDSASDDSHAKPKKPGKGPFPGAAAPFGGKARPKRGRRDPASAGRAKGKKVRPAPQPGGTVDQEVSGSPWAGKSSAPWSMQALHAATCPLDATRGIEKSLGVTSIQGAIPVREFQTMALAAMAKGQTDLADYYIDLVKTAESIQEFPDSVLQLVRADKIYRDQFPDTHPATHGDITPGMFQRQFLSSGHPPSAGSQASSGNQLPNAIHHHLDAGDFKRGYLTDGHARAPMGGGTQAGFDSAVIGSAVNAMARFHQHTSSVWPDLCQARITERNYAGESNGSTGFSAAHAPAFPTAPGESSNTSQNYRKALNKAKKRISRLEAENKRLGALPDPNVGAFRGIPAHFGPVDELGGMVGKAAGGPADDAADVNEYADFLKILTHSGDPSIRLNAESVLKGLMATP